MRKAFFTFWLTILLVCATVNSLFAESYGLVTVPFTSLRQEPAHSSELLSQVTMGHSLVVVADTTSDWLTVRCDDGYEGFINRSAVEILSEGAFEEWQAKERMVTTAIAPQVFMSEDSVGLCRLEAGSIVEVDGEMFRLPDGRRGRIAEVKPLKESRLPSVEDIILNARKLMGSPYLWGGNVSSAMDCSGLVRLCFAPWGIMTPRNASQLFECGRRRGADEEPRRGDLLFFSSRVGGGITHVAIYLGDGQYIHCSGQVKVSRMAADDPDFGKRVYRGSVDWSNGEGFTVFK